MVTPGYIKICLRNGIFSSSNHAIQRMVQRQVLSSDILRIGENGSAVWNAKHKSWNVTGQTVDGDFLVVACDDKSPQTGVNIRTVFWINEVQDV